VTVCRAGSADSHSPECVIPDDVLIQFGPPDDEHLLLETCRVIRNKYIKKECIKLVITQNVSVVKTFYTLQALITIGGSGFTVFA
jgi:hypothetical protein